MPFAARSTRKPLVGDVPDQRVLERELLVASNPRDGFPAEGPLLERAEQGGEILARIDARECASPEDATDDGRVDEDASLVGRQSVEAGRDDRANARG